MARAITTRSGRKLSQADVEHLADWIESDEFDLSGATPRPGRPPLEPGSNEHAPRIAVRIPSSLHSRVTARAAAEGSSVSQVVRRLLEGYASDPEAVRSAEHEPDFEVRYRRVERIRRLGEAIVSDAELDDA